MVSATCALPQENLSAGTRSRVCPASVCSVESHMVWGPIVGEVVDLVRHVLLP